MDVNQQIVDRLDKLFDTIANRPQRIALTVDEAAQSLGVTRRTVEGLIDRGEIKAKLIGKRLLISVEQLKKVVN